MEKTLGIKAINGPQGSSMKAGAYRKSEQQDVTDDIRDSIPLGLESG